MTELCTCPVNRNDSPTPTPTRTDGGPTVAETVGASSPKPNRWRGALSAIGLTLLLGLPVGEAGADERAFTLTYEATTMPAGKFEYEQWVTWKTHKQTDARFDRFDFRHEFEFGITDRWQLAIYAADWRYQDGNSVENGTTFKDVAFETIYNLTDPTNDPLGSAVYGEFKIGDALVELEGKLILQKNVGPWIFAWNGTIAAEWEGQDYDEQKGEFAQTLGVSHQLSPALSVGIELLHEVEYEGWSQWGDHLVYLGPNISFRTRNWWITVTPTYQATGVDGEADFLTRLIFGIDF